MQRVTISLDDEIAVLLDTLVRDDGYQSRSEAVRDLVRAALAARPQVTAAHCVASLSFVYDYRKRALAQRLLEMQHEHHDLVVASTNVVLDHSTSLASIVLRGPTGAVRALADAFRVERGVRYGAINFIYTAPNDDHFPGAHKHVEHRHATPVAG